MDAIKFAEWIAENHYILHNVEPSGHHIWKNEYNKKTTKQLYKKFKKDETN